MSAGGPRCTASCPSQACTRAPTQLQRQKPAACKSPGRLFVSVLSLGLRNGRLNFFSLSCSISEAWRRCLLNEQQGLVSPRELPGAGSSLRLWGLLPAHGTSSWGRMAFMRTLHVGAVGRGDGELALGDGSGQWPAPSPRRPAPRPCLPVWDRCTRAKCSSPPRPLHPRFGCLLGAELRMLPELPFHTGPLPAWRPALGPSGRFSAMGLRLFALLGKPPREGPWVLSGLSAGPWARPGGGV